MGNLQLTQTILSSMIVMWIKNIMCFYRHMSVKLQFLFEIVQIAYLSQVDLIFIQFQFKGNEAKRKKINQ